MSLFLQIMWSNIDSSIFIFVNSIFFFSLKCLKLTLMLLQDMLLLGLILAIYFIDNKFKVLGFNHWLIQRIQELKHLLLVFIL